MIIGTQSPQIETVTTPLWRELFTGFDWVRLKLSLTNLGLGVPHGSGEGVIVIPGHRANDLYLAEMLCWLIRIGYLAKPSGIRWNDECLDLLADQLVEKGLKLNEQTGKPICYIGHSLGGMQAAAAARRAQSKRPGSVATVIALGTPQQKEIRVHGIIHTSLKMTQRRIRRQGGRPGCYGAGCGCTFGDDARGKIPGVRRVSIYTLGDGIVIGQNCRQEEGDDQTNFQVSAVGHIALAFNPQVYRIIAGILHESYTKKPAVTA